MGVNVIVLALESEAACTGKTTTLRVLTSSFVTANRSVFIANAGTIDDGDEDDLGEWAFKLLGEPDEPQLIDYRQIKSPDALIETLRTKRRTKDNDFLIIDTSNGRPTLADIARKSADLTLIPSIQRCAESASRPTLAKSADYQLSYEVFSKSTRKRSLRSMLPRSEIFADQNEGGHIPDMLRAFSQRTRETTKSPSRHKVSFERRQAAKAAWSAAQSLAWEVEWLARGYSLAKVEASEDRFGKGSEFKRGTGEGML
ncbi:hypothetical protein [Dinoroseobacter sp. S375]|uniref:hypothetical protein n=1 Tax=Dinoroseobacter sp. S375 TaxID=3415136 RepID=UPI003C7C5438